METLYYMSSKEKHCLPNKHSVHKPFIAKIMPCAYCVELMKITQRGNVESNSSYNWRGIHSINVHILLQNDVTILLCNC